MDVMQWLNFNITYTCSSNPFKILSMTQTSVYQWDNGKNILRRLSLITRGGMDENNLEQPVTAFWTKK